MKGICFNSVGDVSLQSLAEPQLNSDGDAIVKIQTAGLCGSDFHPFFGREKGLDAGTVMGHEFVGEIVRTGSSVSTPVGTRVCAPFTTNCGDCFYCRIGLTARCKSGQLLGWRSNSVGLHGGQAEYIRIPFADSTLLPVPDSIDNQTALLIGDNLSTGDFCASMIPITDEGIYVVIGCGTVGLLALWSARRRGAKTIFAVDPVADRRERATSIGAISHSPESITSAIMAVTENRGADGVMELVGLPSAQSLAYELIRPGGTMSVIGCHCTPNFTFSPTDAYDKNLTYRTGRCSARAFMPTMIEECEQTEFPTNRFVTHHFAPSEAKLAYDVMSNQKDGCIKAVFDF